MRYLLDTHLLLWAAGIPEQLPNAARAILEDPDTIPIFSAASIWEIAIKNAMGRQDFQADARLLHRGLLDNGYEELPIMGIHAATIANLPPLHKDPFDRILVAQAMVEEITLLTADALVAQYPGTIQRV